MTESSTQPTILLVDDEPAILDALEDLLEEDFHVLKAGGGAQGLELLAQHTVAVVLSDQKMPGMRGEEFLARVAQNHVATRVLLTGYTDFDDLVRAVNRGHIYAFVSKPWSPHELRSLVKAAAERFHLQKELLHEKHLLDLLLESTPDLISIKDHDSRYLRLNSACAKALGLGDALSAMGKTDGELGGPLFQEATEREQQVLAQGIPDMDRTEKLCRGTHWYSSTRVATSSADGPPLVIGISRNITERLQRNRRLQAHVEQLERVNKEMGRFSFIVAHHLQEPIRTIGSFTDLLHRRSLLKEGAQEYVEYIDQSVRRARSLMRDFGIYLDLHHRRPKRLVSLAEMARSAVASLAAQHGEVPHFAVRGDASIVGDEELLKQLFRAVLENAIVHAGLQHEVEVTMEGQEGAAMVAVDDRGPGVPEAARRRVFRLFETLETEGRSGLGLALCQKIVELHGGDIWLDSSPVGGLRVAFTLHGQEKDDLPGGILPAKEANAPSEMVDRQARFEELEAQISRLELFASTAAHDLHEPLRMITSYLTLLERREGPALTESGKAYLNYAVDGAQRMKELIDGILTYARSGMGGTKTEKDLHDILSEVLCDLEVLICESDAHIEVGKLSQTRIDSVEGRQLLSNLIANALKYRGSKEPVVRITAEAGGDSCVVTVADNGIGVPADMVEAIFQPFVRGDWDGQARGAGLGLATCWRIVNGWGGKIWCQSEEGQGSRFHFTIPL